jgi:hypothetical protein
LLGKVDTILNTHLYFVKVKRFSSCLFMCRMSLYEMSGVTVVAGMTSNKDTAIADVQMTRRISKVVLHSKFNAFTHVSCSN